MLLDLRNNELIFSKIEDKTEFKQDLQAMKGVKAREYKEKFYISVAHIDTVRQVMSAKYRGKITFSYSYQKFADRFILDKNPITIKWHPDICEVRGSGMPWHILIPETSYFNKKATNSKQYGKSWSGYTHLFHLTEGTFPSGLIGRITRTLHGMGIPFHVKQTFDYPEPYLNLNPVFDFSPTQDQVNAVKALAKWNNGIGKLPTGFGKTSYVAAALMAKKGVRALFLANQKVLTDDAMSDFKSVFRNDDVEIGMIGDGEYDPGDITIASIQTVATSLKPPLPKERETAQYQYDLAEQRFREATDDEMKKDAEKDMKRFRKRLEGIRRRQERHEKIIPFLKTIDMFIVDEAQVLGTEQWNAFLHACPAAYRYTMSATPTRSDGGGLQIVAATGDVRFESSAGEQIEKGRLSEFLAHFTKFDHKMDRNVIKDLKMEYHQAYDVFIVQNERRNRHLCGKVMEWAKNHSVLALVTRKEHGEIIRNMLREMGLGENGCHYIDGDTPKKKRKDTIEAFRNGEFPVLIGTSIFDVGFNAKNAAKMVRFNAGGSEVREPQRAGRTVRIREDGSIGESYDLIDINCPFFEAQGWKRHKFLKEEFGKERMRFHRETIEGELNIVGLRQMVDELPDKTDKAKGEDIIRTLQFGETDPDDLPDLELDDMDEDLQTVFSELIYPE